MTPIRVESIDDPRVVPYRDLPSPARRDRPSWFIAEGALVVERLLASDYETDSVLVDERRLEWVRGRVSSRTPVYVASRRLLEQIVGFNFHQGIIACGRRKAARPLSQVLPADGGRLLVVICADIQDPENLGGILRNCAAFGVDVAMVNHRCTDPFSRRVLRVSMGTVFKLPLVVTRDLDHDLRALRETWNVMLNAAVLDGRASALEETRRSDREAILLGNEAEGLPPRWIELCDRRTTIAMRNGTDSLNVAVASGIFLYHLTRIADIDVPS